MADTKNIDEPRITDDDFRALDPSKMEEELHRLYTLVRDKAYGAVAWYEKARTSKKRWARFIRISSIVLISAAGLVPIAISFWPGLNKLGEPTTNIGQLGYVLAAVAAALLGLDKFFGFSSGWSRYILTELDIKGRLGRFQMEWVIANACLEDDEEEKKCPNKRLKLLQEFSIEITKLIEDETKLWTAEFQGSMAALEKTVRETREAQRPGTIKVTLKKGSNIKGRIELQVDGQTLRSNAGATNIIAGMTPGMHEVRAVGTDKSGNEITVSQIANVPAGGEVSVPLKLE